MNKKTVAHSKRKLKSGQAIPQTLKGKRNLSSVSKGKHHHVDVVKKIEKKWLLELTQDKKTGIRKEKISGSKGLIFTSIYKEHEKPDKVEKWGKQYPEALKEEIRSALVHLGREPQDVSELKDKILKDRKESTSRVLKEAEAQRSFISY